MKKGNAKNFIMSVAALFVLVLYAVLAVAFLKIGYNTFGMIFIAVSIAGGVMAVYLISGGSE